MQGFPQHDERLVPDDPGLLPEQGQGGNQGNADSGSDHFVVEFLDAARDPHHEFLVNVLATWQEIGVFVLPGFGKQGFGIHRSFSVVWWLVLGIRHQSERGVLLLRPIFCFPASPQFPGRR